MKKIKTGDTLEYFAVKIVGQDEYQTIGEYTDSTIADMNFQQAKENGYNVILVTENVKVLNHHDPLEKKVK